MSPHAIPMHASADGNIEASEGNCRAEEGMALAIPAVILERTTSSDAESVASN